MPAAYPCSNTEITVVLQLPLPRKNHRVTAGVGGRPLKVFHGINHMSVQTLGMAHIGWGVEAVAGRQQSEVYWWKLLQHSTGHSTHVEWQGSVNWLWDIMGLIGSRSFSRSGWESHSAIWGRGSEQLCLLSLLCLTKTTFYTPPLHFSRNEEIEAPH